MTKVRVDWDEQYPVFFIVEGGAVEIELSAAELDMVEEAEAACTRAQELLRERSGYKH
jgi:hypothetical protein